MKIKMLKDVVSTKGWRYEGQIYELDAKIAKHYLSRQIGIEVKEEKAAKQTKENKTAKKRTTKKAK
jgi:hypothetical protein